VSEVVTHDWERVFQELLTAEAEADALAVLGAHDLLEPSLWVLLGDQDNNFSIVGNQHSEPTGALVEKVINGIDARLMAACFEAGMDPEGPHAPESMRDAVEHFFGVSGGRLGDLTEREQRELASGIQLVAVGRKDSPSYLIIDEGEGQTPRSFPDTFMSLARSNKLRIPFVQGKFNSGGTAVLQFCGRENLQLIASRRHPAAPVEPSDPSAGQWGFTVVRRIEPAAGDSRRNSMYVYLAPGNAVPAFTADSISVRPGLSRKGQPAPAYSEPLSYGTVVKLYEYRWKAPTLATTEARFELEKYLHAPALPFRVIESREYRANYYATTVSGIWASIEADEGSEERGKVEEGFPTSALLDVPNVGQLVYRIVVFKEDRKPRRIPKGVVFTVNGQVHGQLPSDFVSRKLEFEYLAPYLLVSVDCTNMRTRVREDFFPAARDRIRRNEAYDSIVARLTTDLKQHPGLKALNAARRSRRLQKALSDQEDVLKTLNDLLSNDPALRALFEAGDRLTAKVGPTETEEFRGQRFPTYFRLQGNPKDPLLKQCPANRSCRVIFETDAANDYFDRSQSPGKLLVTGSAVLEYSHLWNGQFVTRWRPPDNAQPGDVIDVAVMVTDLQRESEGKTPFSAGFTVRVTEPDFSTRPPGGSTTRKGPSKNSKSTAPRLALPNIATIRKDDWDKFSPPFTEHDALRVSAAGDGTYDYTVNVDNVYLITELSKAKDADKDLVVHWFKYGLAISAMGMIQHGKRAASLNGCGSTRGNGANASNGAAPTLDQVNAGMNGLASVIVPIIRTLHRAPI
jgi:hypothetical protein